LPSSFLIPGEPERGAVGDEIIERPPLTTLRAAA
jgi:hypothetical protein